MIGQVDHSAWKKDDRIRQQVIQLQLFLFCKIKEEKEQDSDQKRDRIHTSVTELDNKES